jgi:hypothetical protein
MINSTPPTFEDDFFDCKVEPFDADVNKRKAALQKVWSKALTAFANSGGGVVVWGLVAKPDPVGNIDMVIGERLVDNLAQLENDLRKLQPVQTDPPLSGVEYTPIAVDGGPGGFLVCFIPQGPHQPYKQLSGDRQYWYWAGDTTREMPRHMLQAMFYPRIAPSFAVDIELGWQPSNKRLVAATLEIRVANDGTGTARDTVIRVGRFFPGNAAKPQPVAFNDWQTHTLGYRTANPIHPGTPPYLAFGYAWEATKGLPSEAPVFDQLPRLTLAVHADNTEPQFFLWQPTEVDLQSLYFKRALAMTARRLENAAEFQEASFPTASQD